MAKDIIKSSISYTIIGFLPFSFAFFFTPIYLNYLDKEQYGILNLFTLYTGIFAQLFSVGLTRGFYYFYWDVYKDKRQLSDLIGRTLGLLLIFQFLFISTFIIFGNYILPALTKSTNLFTYNLYLITLFQASILSFYEFFCFYYRNEGKIVHYSIISIGTLVILTIVSLLCVVTFNLEAAGAIYGRFIGYASIIGIFLIIFIKKNGLSFNIKKSKTLLIFSLPVFVNAFVGSISYGADKILIEKLDTIANLGVYGFALVFVSILELWFNSISNAINPTLYKFLKESIVEKEKEIQGLVYLIICSIFVLIGLLLAFVYPVLDVLIPEEFHMVTTLIPVLSVAFLYRVYTSIIENSIYLKKKTKLFLFNQTSTLLFIMLFGWIGYNLYGILGIVFAVYMVRLFEFLVMKLLIKKTIKLPIPLNRIYVSTFLFTLLAIFIALLDKQGIINNYLLYTIPLMFVLFILPFILKKEIKLIQHIFKKRKEILT